MTQSPPLVKAFVNYKISIQNRSPRTADQYELDLILFFKYLLAKRNGLPLSGEAFDNIELSSVDIEFIRSITEDEIYDFFLYVSRERENQARARARKLSSIKSFFRYLESNRKLIDKNPAAQIEAPSIKRALPKYLTLEESLRLLDTVENDTQSESKERDYAIVTLFLNCGMRLSELCGINLSDIDSELRSLRVLGKGAKERIIYLNDACRDALKRWLIVRNKLEIKDKNALFISRLGKRISNKTVQWMIYKYLNLAGLGNRHLSVHKLRHTAATLMYQEGGVDVLVLKDILGHEQLNTTQIYTHIGNRQLEDAVRRNPLANKKRATPEPGASAEPGVSDTDGLANTPKDDEA